jgi:hypothetical protein
MQYIEFQYLQSGENTDAGNRIISNKVNNYIGERY